MSDTKSQDVLMRNLHHVWYEMSAHSVTSKVTSMVTWDDYVFVGLLHNGLEIFHCSEKIVKLTNLKLGLESGLASIYDIIVSKDYIVYFVENEDSQCSLWIHNMSEVILHRMTKPIRIVNTKKRGAVAVDGSLKYLAVSGIAWSSSWTSAGPASVMNTESLNDQCIRVLDITSGKILKDFSAVVTSVALLRIQISKDCSLLGVADACDGVYVYDLKRPTHDGYTCIFQVSVDDVRDLELVGDVVAVFHKFEANVSLWNMSETKTVLCLNIQMGHQPNNTLLFEDEDEEENALCLAESSQDYATCVCVVPLASDYLLLYGTRSGWILGMSVNQRSQVLSIPCPVDGKPVPRVLNLAYLQSGCLVAVYEHTGLLLLDFSREKPPNTPGAVRLSREAVLRPQTT